MVYRKAVVFETIFLFIFFILKCFVYFIKSTPLSINPKKPCFRVETRLFFFQKRFPFFLTFPFSKKKDKKNKKGLVVRKGMLPLRRFNQKGYS